MFSFIHNNSIISGIERKADRATNVAEASISGIEGTDIRRHYPEKETKD